MYYVWVGYDTREVEAFELCKHSLIRRSSEPVKVHAIMESCCRAAALYWRPYSRNETGQRIDSVDGKPFSTDFSFTRFLVPELARRQGLTGRVLYVDCDFIFQNDVVQLFNEPIPNDKAVWVVKHNYAPENARKMDGMAQEKYSKKLWSSLMLFNLDHPATIALTPEVVNTKPGSFLHQFKWCSPQDVGEIDERWNWLPGSSPTIQWDGFTTLPMGAIHYTEGIPGMSCREETELDRTWYREKAHYEAAHPLPYRMEEI